jgi:hypothetical protein
MIVEYTPVNPEYTLIIRKLCKCDLCEFRKFRLQFRLRSLHDTLLSEIRQCFSSEVACTLSSELTQFKSITSQKIMYHSSLIRNFK